MKELTKKEIKDLKKMVGLDNFFVLFTENHLKHYPEDRFDTALDGGFTVPLDPLTAMRLSGVCTSVKKAVQDNIEKFPVNIARDLLQIYYSNKTIKETV